MAKLKESTDFCFSKAGKWYLSPTPDMHMCSVVLFAFYFAGRVDRGLESGRSLFQGAPLNVCRQYRKDSKTLNSGYTDL
jgi:hypothetical protein